MEAIGGFIGAFFLFGGFWFWVLAAVTFGVLVALADHEENFWAAALVGVFFLGLFHFNTWVINWSLVPWVVLIYLVLGVVMSFIKWIMYLKARASRYARLKLEWYDYRKTDYNLPSIDKSTNMKEVLDSEQYLDFIKYLKHEDFITHREQRIIPQWKDKQKKLVSWALWWPAVIFWSVLNDFIINAFNNAVRAMRAWYEGIAKKVFAGVGVSDTDENEYYKHD